MDTERAKIYDIVDKVRTIMESYKPRDGKGFTEDEIKFIVEKHIPGYNKDMLDKYFNDVEFVQIGSYRIAFAFEVESLLYNMLYHHS